MIYLVSGASRLRGSARLCGSARLRGWSGSGCVRLVEIEILLVDVGDETIRNFLKGTRGRVVEPPHKLLDMTIFTGDDARSEYGYRPTVHKSLFEPDTVAVINAGRAVGRRRMLLGALGIRAGPPSTSGVLETKSITGIEATGDKVILVNIIHHNDIRPEPLLRQSEFEHGRILNTFFLLGVLEETGKFSGSVPWWRARHYGSEAQWWIGDEGQVRWSCRIQTMANDHSCIGKHGGNRLKDAFATTSTTSGHGFWGLEQGSGPRLRVKQEGVGWVIESCTHIILHRKNMRIGLLKQKR